MSLVARAASLSSLLAIVSLTASAAEFTLISSFTDYGRGYETVNAVRNGNVCSLTGLARTKSGKKPSGRIRIGQLSSDCRPAAQVMFETNNHTGASRIDVFPDGKVEWTSGFNYHWVSMNGINIPVGKVHRNLSLNKGFTNYGRGWQPMATYRQGSQCFVTGLIRPATKPKLPVTAAVLQPDCRPYQRLIYSQQGLRVDVFPNGHVNLRSGSVGSYINLSGIEFHAKVPGNALKLQNGWQNYGGGYQDATYHVEKNGLCTLSGLIRGSQFTDLGLLPGNCRPKGRVIMDVMASGRGHTRIDLKPTGQISFVTGGKGGWVSLSGITVPTRVATTTKAAGKTQTSSTSAKSTTAKSTAAASTPTVSTTAKTADPAVLGRAEVESVVNRDAITRAEGALVLDDRLVRIGQPGNSGNGMLRWEPRLPRYSSSHLFGVHCLSQSICYAVGEVGSVLKSVNGGVDWVQTGPVGETASLREIYCVSDARCWAVGDRGLIIRTANGGGSWSRQASGTTRNLHDIHCQVLSSTPSGGARCYAVGDQMLLVSLQGDSWRPDWPLQTDAREQLQQGVDLAKVARSTIPVLTGVDCAAPNVCFAVGPDTTLQRPTRTQDADPQEWNPVPHPLSRFGSRNVSCANSQLCFLDEQELAPQPNNGQWMIKDFVISSHPPSSLQRIGGIACQPEGWSGAGAAVQPCVTVGSYGQFTVFTQGNSTGFSNWEEMRLQIATIGGPTADSLTVEDARSRAEIRTGAYPLNDVSCAPDRRCVAVGNYGMIAWKIREQSNWFSNAYVYGNPSTFQTLREYSDQATPNPARVFLLGDISCGSDSSCVAGFKGMGGTQESAWHGREGFVRTADGGSQWQFSAVNSTLELLGISELSCFDAQRCVAIGDGDIFGGSEQPARYIYRTQNGGAHWAREVRFGGPLRNLSCLAPGICWLLENGSVLKSTNGGQNWTAAGSVPPLTFPNSTQIVPDSARLTDLQCPSSNICFSARTFGELWKSMDGGASWFEIESLSQQLGSYTFQANGSQHTGHHGYSKLTCPSESRCLAFYGKGGVARIDLAAGGSHTLTRFDAPWADLDIQPSSNPVTLSPASVDCLDVARCVAIVGYRDAGAFYRRGVYSTSDGGATWIEESAPQNAKVLHALQDESAYRVSCAANSCMIAGSDGDLIRGRWR